MKNKIKAELEQLLSANSVGSTINYIRYNPQLKEELTALTKEFNPRSIPEMMYIIIHGVVMPSCGKKTYFVSFNRGYKKYCGKMDVCQCARDNLTIKAMNRSDNDRADIAAKRSKTTLEKYGVVNAGQTDKARENHKKLYSDPEAVLKINDRISTTNKERYGGHPTKLPETQQKRVGTTVKRYGVEHVSQSTEIKEQMLQRNLEKYGHEYTLSVPSIRQQIRQTNLKKYGYEIASQSDEVKEKSKTTCIERYGVTAAITSSEIKERIRLNNIKKYGSVEINGVTYCRQPTQQHIPDDVLVNFNTPEWWETAESLAQLKRDFGSIVSDTFICVRGRQFAPHLFDEKGISLPHQMILDIIPDNVEYTINDRSVISPKELDIHFPQHNFAIEMNGVYWHSEVSGNKDKNYHINKYNECQQKGIDLYQFWDYEVLKNIDIIKSMILNKLGISQKIYARKCKIVDDVPSKAVNEFFENNHMQGAIGFSQAVGLEHNGELVSLASFGKPRYRKDVDYELLRFATKKGHNVVGGFSKIMSSLGNASIVSYANKRWSNGNVYQKNGFSLAKSNEPSYFYTKNYYQLHNRVQFQKHKLSGLLESFNPNVSEWENMKANNWDRVWDCGSDTYIKRSNLPDDE